MSTRATYKFNKTEWFPQVTFYIHHDGYPSGAAVYFKKMLAVTDEFENICDAFYRANDRAELTLGHEAHADTEYQYTVERIGTLTAYHSKWDGEKACRGDIIFKGPLEDFFEFAKTWKE